MEQTAMQAKDVLTWTQEAYYGAGAIVAFMVAFIKIRVIFRRRKKEKE
jgi:flagellar biosynthesis/type III secretory pathway M-ring protein FliF/YscJ